MELQISTMSDDNTGKIIAEGFQQQLSDLVENDKKMIDGLTMIAQDNDEYPKEISKVIEKRIYEVCC